MRVILIGFMGSGKTSFGKKLASKLNLTFIDSDLEISLNEGKSINVIFEEYGEEKFREMEREFLISLSKSEGDFVLSTGGGMPCYLGNMDLLNEIGTTIYLELSPKALVKRLENGLDERPLLKDMSESELLTFITEKLELREKFYKKAKIIQPGLSLNGKILNELISKLESMHFH